MKKKKSITGQHWCRQGGSCLITGKAVHATPVVQIGNPNAHHVAPPLVSKVYNLGIATCHKICRGASDFLPRLLSPQVFI